MIDSIAIYQCNKFLQTSRTGSSLAAPDGVCRPSKHNRSTAESVMHSSRRKLQLSGRS